MVTRLLVRLVLILGCLLLLYLSCFWRVVLFVNRLVCDYCLWFILTFRWVGFDVWVLLGVSGVFVLLLMRLL